LKIARYEHELPEIESEVQAYRIIEGRNIGPRFFGHLTENGRIMGILVEYITNARRATVADFEVCVAVLRRLHELKVLLGDTNRNNFLVSADGRSAMICDFAGSELDANDVAIKEEEVGLMKSLADEEFDEEEGMWDAYGEYRFTEVPHSEYRI
jgi:hypothetical protein